MLIGHTLITRHPELRSMRRNASLAAIRQPRGPQRTKPETFAHRSVDLVTVAPFLRRQGHHCLMDFGIDRQHAIDRLFCPFPPKIEGVFVVHHISRFSLRRPQYVSLRSGLNARST